MVYNLLVNEIARFSYNFKTQAILNRFYTHSPSQNDFAWWISSSNDMHFLSKIEWFASDYHQMSNNNRTDGIFAGLYSIGMDIELNSF